MNTLESFKKFFKDPTIKSHIYIGSAIFVGLVIAMISLGQVIQGSENSILRVTSAILVLFELAILVRCFFLVREKFNEEMEVRSSLEDSISMVENISLGRLNQRLSVSKSENIYVRNLQQLLNEVAESLIRDLADRKWQESEYQRYLALINHSTDFIAMFSTEGRLLYVNQTGREMLGLRSPNYALGFTFSDYFSKSSWEDVHHRWSQLKSRGEFQLESSLRHFQTGEIIPTSARFFSVKGSQTGDVLCYATIQSDIRAQKQAEAFIEQHRAIVVTNSKMTALGEMAGGIAHEINNPLIVITGFLDE
ncbi:MAG TPA: PAS domain S-box protein, partial [Pseudobdellovibrionaceae bacterium]|nr:PAS domain S-box protein [Pseudobdellovibrionaceae bacterium]